MPLIQLPDIARTRAMLGLRDPRNNAPATFAEVLESMQGLSLKVTWSREGPNVNDVRILPVEIPRGDGFVTDVFMDARDSDEQSRKQEQRAAERGHIPEPPLSPEELAAAPKPRFDMGRPLTLIAYPRERSCAAWLWPAAAAKITLGCLCKGAELGLWPQSTKDALVVHALRMLAFDHRCATDIWRPEELSTSPQRPAQTHALAGTLANQEHLVVLHRPERVGQSPLAQIVLFGRELLELRLPRLKLRTSYAWLFTTTDRHVAGGLPETLVGIRRKRAVEVRQPSLF